MNEAEVTLSEATPEQIRQEHLMEEFEKGSIVEITFIKADGSRRVMICARKPEDVGIDFDYSEDDHRHQAPGIQTVWDIQNEGWRSFRWDRLESFRVGAE